MISTERPTAGRYLLRQRLGVGAGGEVWSAEDPHIGRPVAVKLLKVPEGLSERRRSEWERRFLLEARAAGRLSHPGIVSIHDVGTTGDGRPYIVMELVEGENLDAARRAPEPPPIPQVVAWTIQIAEALDAAHAKGVVHRDIKPANLLVGVDGRARIADFGIARVSESELTREGAFVGSPAFAAPEQIRGDKVDGRADLFSLGAVLYLLATGSRPFEGENLPAIAYAVCHAEPERPSSLNPRIEPAFEAVILKALAKNPADRYATGAELAQALRAAIDPEPLERTVVEAAPVDPVESQAATIASAAAVGAVRLSRAAAAEARRLAVAFAGWCRRAAPKLREHPRFVGAVAAAAIVVFAAWYFEVGASRPEPGARLGERLRAIAAGRTSDVAVVVDHGLENGVLEISSGGETLLRRTLHAPERRLLGVFTHRSGEDGSRLRLRSGVRDLRIAVTGADGLSLSKTLEVEVDPKADYRLAIDVASWPTSRLSADWDTVEER